MVMAEDYGIPVIGGVHISKGPVDVHVRNGQVARFPCHNQGTRSFPYWRIGNRLYTTLRLPSQHNYDSVHQELVVRYIHHLLHFK